MAAISRTPGIIRPTIGARFSKSCYVCRSLVGEIWVSGVSRGLISQGTECESPRTENWARETRAQHARVIRLLFAPQMIALSITWLSRSTARSSIIPQAQHTHVALLYSSAGRERVAENRAGCRAISQYNKDAFRPYCHSSLRRQQIMRHTWRQALVGATQVLYLFCCLCMWRFLTHTGAAEVCVVCSHCRGVL